MNMKKNYQTVDSKLESNIERISEIAEFYAGCNVLVTGASGFVGQLLIEKLLRSCPKIKKLYLILRAKKGKSSEERYEEIFEDFLYERLKSEQPNFQDKVVMIEGEFNQSGLAISPGNRELLKDSHIVFHGAASVRFDDKLRFAVNINVRGTNEILLLCKEMPNIKAIVYVGTAFSHCVHKLIDEIFYEPPIDSDKIIALTDLLNDEQLETLTPTLVGEYPNTYAFSKSTAENVVQKYIEELPICIVRPSIMIATEREPVPGWINNIYGPQGVVVGAGAGLLHSLHADPNNVADVIPADYVINNIVASAWDIDVTWRAKKQQALSAHQDSEKKIVETKPPIYNSVTSIQNPITWGDYTDYTKSYGPEFPSSMAIWNYFFTMNKRLWLHNIHTFLFHIIPAIIVDSLARLVGRKPILLDAYKKIHKFSRVVSYFGMQQWIFRNDNVINLWNKMSPIDRKRFYFNVSEFEWPQFFYFYVRGIRVYLLKDPMSTLEQAKKRYFKLTILHYVVSTIFSLLLLRLVYSMTSAVYKLMVS